MLFVSQVQSSQGTVAIRGVVDGKPTREGIAAPPLAGPVEATLSRVVEGVPAEIGVIARFDLTDRAHGLEVSEPPLGSIYADRYVPSCGSYDNAGIDRGVGVGLTPSDIISDLA